MSTTSAPARMERVGDNLYRKGGTFYAAAVPPGKRRLKFKSLKTDKKMRAKELLPDALKEIRATRQAPGAALTPQSSSADIFDAFLAHKKRTVSERTYKDSLEPAIRLHLKPWFAEHAPKAARITPEDLIEWHTDQLEAGAAAWSILARWGALTGALKFAVRRGVITLSPADLLEPDERPAAGEPKHRYLSDPEMKALVDAAHTPRWRLLILVMLFAGLRLSEALGLRWDDVDFDDGVIRVRNQLRRRKTSDESWLKGLKTGAGRRDVVLMKTLAVELRRAKLASRYSRPQHPVFVTGNGTFVSQRNATREFTRAVGYSKLDRVTPHALRHTFASVLVFQTKGADVAFVADQLGHADPSVTLRIYVKLFRAAKSRAAARDALDAEFGAVIAGGR